MEMDGEENRVSAEPGEGFVTCPQGKGGGLGMESWHSVVLRMRANLAMQWREVGNEQMGAI